MAAQPNKIESIGGLAPAAVPWKNPLRILHLEDDANDAALVEATLESENVDCSLRVVQTRVDFIGVLEAGGVDIVLSDFLLPSFDGLSALEIVKKRWPEIPFILVSGTLGEELAIESLKSGATDYVLKGRLSRLVPSLRRAMQEVMDRVGRRRLEEQFIQSQKAEVIGHLAAGIAHDFNNILAVIMGYSDLIMMKLDANDATHKDAQEIQHAAERAAALTRQLLVFSRSQAVQPVVLDLNEVVEGMEKMLRRLITENIDLKMATAKNLGRIRADCGHVEQVLMNLVVNARDAMPEGGHIIVETSNLTVRHNEARRQADVPAGEYVLLSVTDTGVGITDDVMAHLFEAFFTTKPKGKGTGLGLATCQTIVKQCDGHIRVSSEVGKSTTFRIFFPRVDQPMEAVVHHVSSGVLPVGTETVLLVEDEPALRHLACTMLELQGYTVLRATNGAEGVTMARHHRGAPIALVITDVIMPLMDGKAMAELLRTTYPGLRTLFTSGYNDETIAHHGVLDPGVSFLAKPYTPAMLTRKVREVLDTTP